MDYYTEIQALEKELNVNNKSPDNLAALQAKLTGLMLQYRDDESLDADRYALYQVQAMLSFRLGDYGKAKRFIDYAVYVRGENYKLADELNKHLMQQEFDPKDEKKWWWLIFAPIGGLVVVGFLQLIVHFALNQSTGTGVSNSVSTLVNIFSIIVGTVSVILVLFLPIWIIELVSAKKYNEGHGYTTGLRKRTGVLIAVFLPIWYWSYTYRVDKGKFWLNFILSICTAGYWGIVAWFLGSYMFVKEARRFLRIVSLLSRFAPTLELASGKT